MKVILGYQEVAELVK